MAYKRQKDEDMNVSQIRNILQYLVSIVSAYAVGKGYVDQGLATEIGAWILAGVPVALAIYHARDAGKLESAAKVPGVTIVAPDDIANASTKTNIVPASTNAVSDTTGAK